MKLGNFKFFILLFVVLSFTKTSAEEKIQSVPLINLENLSPTFEEGKDELEKIEEKEIVSNDEESKEANTTKNDKIYINIKALDKITAKTSSIKLAVGEKKLFGTLEIKALKCQLSENNNFIDTVAYLQVRDISKKDNDQVFLFNGWTFASNPTLQSIDHPVYDLWINNCENI